jgi:hypothetical protein
VDSPKRFVLGLVAVSLCVCGVLAVLFLIFGRFDGAMWRILTTVVLLGLFSLLALPGALLLDQGRGSILAWSAVLLSVAAFLWSFRIVWVGPDGDDGSWRLLVTLTACATALSQVCATTARRHETDPAIVDRLYGLSTLLAYCLAGLVTLAAWDALAPGGLFWRVLTAAAVIDLVAVGLQPLLRHRERVA